MITLALSKGRIFDETRPLLAAAGIAPLEDPETSRKLIIGTTNPELRIVVVRASDVPTYVQYGAADFGVAGKDVLMEHGGAGLYQPVDLGIARCRLCVAVPAGFDYANAVRRGARLRVATKYVQTAREHFAAKGVHVDVIKLYGSMELAPLAGLADVIVDLVSSGGTLKANNLVEVEEIARISSRLIVNQSSMKLKRDALMPIVERIQQAVRCMKVRTLDSRQPTFDAEFAELVAVDTAVDREIERVAAGIVDDVKTRGDAALLEYTNRFDRMRVRAVAGTRDPGAARCRRRSPRCRSNSAPRSKAQRAASARTTSTRSRRPGCIPRTTARNSDSASTRSTASACTSPAGSPPIRPRC